jgi:prephenate dehydrogenase
MFECVAIVGVGLMGGSLGLATKQRRLARNVIGVGRSRERLQKARELGLVDSVSDSVSEAAQAADFVVVALPVMRIAETVHAIRGHCPRNCLITDMGSTKQEIVSAIEQTGGKGEFVGCHPLAGDHRSGCEFARGDLYQDRLTVLTPTSGTSPAAVQRLAEFWQALDSRVVMMSPADHDQLVAQSSHVPHLAAAAVAAATTDEAMPLVASGWFDTTRVASGDVQLWQQILATNRQAVVAAADTVIANLQAFRDAIANGDDTRLISLLAEGKQKRDAVGN